MARGQMVKKYEWDFKKDAEKCGSSDGMWYDLTDGGYINPEELLEYKEQREQLYEAIRCLESFEAALKKANLLEEF